MKKISDRKKKKALINIQKNNKPSTDELLFHPEIQSIFEQCVSLIRNNEKDSAIEILIGLMDFSQGIWKNNVETEPNKWVMMERPIGLQWYYACIAIIKRRIEPYNVWLQKIMGDWFHNCRKDNVISEDLFRKLMLSIDRYDIQ